MVLIPTVKWAQRSSVVYVTIDVQDSKDPQIELSNTEDGSNGQLSFKATATGGVEDQLYELELTLFKSVDKEKSKISVSPRSIFLALEKSEAETWPRLTKDSSKHLTHIKVDWDKWVDSDDEGDDNDPSAGMDMSSLAGMGGMGGMMGGMGGMGGMMGGMGGMMGGMGGMDGLADMMGGMGGGGMDFSAMGAGADGEGGAAAAGAEDSDDEDLPELEA